MSRSKLKDKYMPEYIKKETERKYSRLSKHNGMNKHKYDEMPKNKPSKYISSRCGNVEWLQEPSNYSGHKVHKNGHTMVSGIVRAKVKEEIREIINSEQPEIDMMEDIRNNPFAFEDYCNSCDNFETDNCPFKERVEYTTKWKELNCCRYEN